MRRFFCMAIGITCVFFLQGYALAAGDLRIGVVDMQKFQEKSVAFQKVRGKLREKFESLQKKLDTEKQELRKVEEEFKKQGMMLSLDAKEDKQKELEKKRRHYKYLYEEYTQEMKDAEMEIRRSVGKEVGKAVEAIGKKKGYVIILERRTLGLIYYKDSIDMTDEIIAAYDRANR